MGLKRKKMKLLKKQVKYTNKAGVEKITNNFYLKFDNGSYVSIKPAFEDDRKVLNLLAEDFKK